MNSLPSPTALRMFVEAAKKSSFAQAAANLNVTQAAVSKQIASLESRIDCVLFERRHRSVSLTPSGETYLPVAEQVLALLETGYSSAASLADREKITIVVDHEFLDFVLVPRLNDLRAAMPQVDISFLPETGRRVSPNCDLAITFGHPSDRGIQSEPLCRFNVFAVGAPWLVNSCPDPLRQLPLLHDVDHYWWTAVLRAENVARSETGFVLGDGAASIRAAMNGAGLAVGDDLLCADALAQGRLSRVGNASLPGRVDYWISSAPQSKDSKVVRSFRNWMNEELRKIDPGS